MLSTLYAKTRVKQALTNSRDNINNLFVDLAKEVSLYEGLGRALATITTENLSWAGVGTCSPHLRIAC